MFTHLVFDVFQGLGQVIALNGDDDQIGGIPLKVRGNDGKAVVDLIDSHAFMLQTFLARAVRQNAEAGSQLFG